MEVEVEWKWKWKWKWNGSGSGMEVEVEWKWKWNGSSEISNNYYETLIIIFNKIQFYFSTVKTSVSQIRY
jgi:hypothetical protein